MLSNSIPWFVVLLSTALCNPLTIGNAVAQSDQGSSIEEYWSGSASIGATRTTGNSESSVVNGSVRLTKSVNRWEHLVFGSAFKGKTSIVVIDRDTNGDVIIDAEGREQRSIVRGNTPDRLSLGYQPRFFYTDKIYIFGILDWERDEPSNIKTATRQILGVGYRFFKDESGLLTGEIGVGKKSSDLVEGDDIDGAIGYLGVNYIKNFTDTATFNADLGSDFGSDNNFVEFGLGLTFKLSDTLNFKIAHFTRNNSNLDSGGSPLSSDNDSLTSINLVFDI